jgi:hypothetical protein
MNAEQLAALGQNALAWAKAFTALKAALVAEGVQPDEAVRVARDTTSIAGMYEADSGEPCPLCGK